MEGPEKPESESQKARVSRKKQLQRMNPAEDERKLQTKLFVKQVAWRLKGRNHLLMKVEEKSRAVSIERSGLFCL